MSSLATPQNPVSAGGSFPSKGSSPKAVEFLLVGIFSALVLGFGIWQVGLAAGYLDPISKAGSQDESFYGRAAIDMAQGRGWMTPMFMERFMLHKPPLLLWAGAWSVKLFGPSAFALRLPVLLAGIGICLLLYAWVRRVRAVLPAFAVVLLLVSDPLLHSFARRFLMDTPLAFWIVAAAWLLWRDPGLAKWSTPVAIGLVSGAAVMTKSLAGLLPLGLLGVYWLLATPQDRPPLLRVITAGLVAFAAAVPWHLYQLLVHRQWFIADYFQSQIVQTGTSVPWSQFFLPLAADAHSLAVTDPALMLLTVVGLGSTLVRSWRDRNGTDTCSRRLLLAWTLVIVAAVTAFRYPSFHYILPLVPAFCVLAVLDSPLFRQKAARVAVPVLLLLLIVKTQAPGEVWGLPFDLGAQVSNGEDLSDYCRLRRSNELVVIFPEDNFYAAALDLPFVRYGLYGQAIDPTKMPGHVYQLGLVLSAGAFTDLPAAKLEYSGRLANWGVENDRVVGTVAVLGSAQELLAIVQSSPDRDFFMPPVCRDWLAASDLPQHEIKEVADGRFFLLAKRSAQRTFAAQPLCSF